MTQTDRVLAASRSYRGVSAVDFQLPHVVDSGKPILRLAARIHDLEERGYVFERLHPRHNCAVYRLVSEPGDGEGERRSRRAARALPSAAVIAAMPSPGLEQPCVYEPPETLFDLPREASSHYRGEAA